MGDLLALISQIKELKDRFGNISTSDYYLDRMPLFFEKGGVPGCTAGLNWVQITPDGMIKRCSDHPVACHFTEWRKDFFSPTECDRCWYSCRGAAQEPWTFVRFFKEANGALNPYCLKKALSR
jgi:MoaA/NifB/PqqE/SkfB family radical SAM enzyme